VSRARLIVTTVALAGVIVACGTRVSIGELAEAKLPNELETDAGSPDDGDADPDASLDVSTTPDATTFDSGDGGWSPCAGKVCGQTCKICPPTEVNCFETAELKACSASGKCSSAPVSCDGGGV
jgi:hypothetical protein